MLAKVLFLCWCLLACSSLRAQVASGSQYLIVQGSFTWHQAKLDAERRGGHLAVITTSEEWDEVVRLFGRDILGVFLGGTDEKEEGVWRWITGETWLFRNWAQRQPDNSGGVQDYLWLHPAYGLAWDDTAGDATSKYLLEIENRYEIVEGALTWDQAKADAERRGGHLATLARPREWTFVTGLLGSSLSRHTEPLWLGANNDNLEKKWTWITAEQWDSQNAQWTIDAPSGVDKAGMAENYLQWTGAKLDGWNDAVRDDRRGYILEIEGTVSTTFGLSLPNAINNGERALTYIGRVGEAYVLQASEDLNSWVDLTSFIALSGGNTFVDKSAKAIPSRIYRVKDASGMSFSPTSIAGKTIRVNVTNGTSPFASSGAYLFQTGANTYKIIPQSDTIVGSSGTYTYAKTGPTTAAIDFTDSLFGNGVAQLRFITQRDGTFSIFRINMSGWQNGNFTIE